MEKPGPTLSSSPPDAGTAAVGAFVVSKAAVVGSAVVAAGAAVVGSAVVAAGTAVVAEDDAVVSAAAVVSADAFPVGPLVEPLSVPSK